MERKSVLEVFAGFVRIHGKRGLLAISGGSVSDPFEGRDGFSSLKVKKLWLKNGGLVILGEDMDVEPSVATRVRIDHPYTAVIENLQDRAERKNDQDLYQSLKGVFDDMPKIAEALAEEVAGIQKEELPEPEDDIAAAKKETAIYSVKSEPYAVDGDSITASVLEKLTEVARHNTELGVYFGDSKVIRLCYGNGNEYGDVLLWGVQEVEEGVVLMFYDIDPKELGKIEAMKVLAGEKVAFESLSPRAALFTNIKSLKEETASDYLVRKLEANAKIVAKEEFGGEVISQEELNKLRPYNIYRVYRGDEIWYEYLLAFRSNRVYYEVVETWEFYSLYFMRSDNSEAKFELSNMLISGRSYIPPRKQLVTMEVGILPANVRFEEVSWEEFAFAMTRDVGLDSAKERLAELKQSVSVKERGAQATAEEQDNVSWHNTGNKGYLLSTDSPVLTLFFPEGEVWKSCLVVSFSDLDQYQRRHAAVIRIDESISGGNIWATAIRMANEGTNIQGCTLEYVNLADVKSVIKRTATNNFLACSLEKEQEADFLV